jgi:hypothetical protein
MLESLVVGLEAGHGSAGDHSAEIEVALDVGGVTAPLGRPGIQHPSGQPVKVPSGIPRCETLDS